MNLTLMHTQRFNLLVLCLSLLQVGQARSQSGAEHVIVAGDIRFSLPHRLSIEKIAGEPLVRWPIVADWDSQGRLVVAESGGVGWPIQEHNKQRLHKIIRLVDGDGDGKFDQRIVAADDLEFPEGVLCLERDILVSAPPMIWRLSDDDDDGVCENREVWFDGTTVTNCANDLHGPYLGRDGWVYWCKGAFGKQTHDLIDGRSMTSTAAHVYRRHIAGGPIEPLISGGMDNPVELAMTPEGESFFTSTFLVHPGNGQRDGIAHAVYGGVFGKDHHVVDDLVQTGPLMEPMTHLGPAAPSGLICVESDPLKRMLGLTRDSRPLIAALFNQHKVTCHELVSSGATYRTIDRDLLVTDRVDFHPTDVIEDSDGSLLVIDTGGWYDLCCPTSRVDQKTASGGIYRVTLRERSAELQLPRALDWDRIDLNGVVAAYFDHRSWIRRAAALRLHSFSDAAIGPLAQIVGDADQSIDRRQHAIWGLCLLQTDRADREVARWINAGPLPLRLSALHVLSLHRVANVRGALEGLLDDDSLLIRRVAAESLGRIGSPESAKLLLQAYIAAEGDRQLEHALVYALIEISRQHPEVDLNRWCDDDAKRHAVFVTLRQTNRDGEIGAGNLFSAIESNNQQLRRTAVQILADHPEYAADCLQDLKHLWKLISVQSSPDQFAPPALLLIELLTGWKDEPKVAELISDWIDSAPQLSGNQQQLLADHLRAICLRPLSLRSSNSIAKWLGVSEPEIRRRVIGQLASLGDYGKEESELTRAIQRYAASEQSTEAKLHWLRALPDGFIIQDSALQQFVVDAFLSQDASVAELAALVVEKSRLSNAHLQSIVKSLGRVSSKHLVTAIKAVQRSTDDQTNLLMLAGLTDLPASRTLPDGFLVTLYRKSSAELRGRAEAISEELIRPSKDIQLTVSKTLANLGVGDPVRGLQVFRSSKAACSACHRMGYIGNTVGPELTRIGGSRTPEALLEAILFPSSRQEQSYQSTQILTIDGDVLNGIVKDRDDAVLKLQVAADRLVEVDLDRIEIEKPSDVSIMPTGIREQLTDQELADLLALLHAAR